jgi:hypothetical protein
MMFGLERIRVDGAKEVERYLDGLMEDGVERGEMSSIGGGTKQRSIAYCQDF